MKLSAPLYNHQGELTGKTTLPESIFGVPANDALLAQALRVYTSRQRQGTKAVKSRGEINKTTQKVWRQKGTGRARHGSRRAPIFVGGGVAHGPTGQENYQLRLSQTMRRQALKVALSTHQLSQTIIALDGVDQLTGKTQALAKLLDTLKLVPQTQPILLILDLPYPKIISASQNLNGFSVTQVKRLNLFEIMRHHTLILTPQAITWLADLQLNK